MGLWLLLQTVTRKRQPDVLGGFDMDKKLQGKHSVRVCTLRGCARVLKAKANFQGYLRVQPHRDRAL